MKIRVFFPGLIGEAQRAMLVAAIFLGLVILGAVLWPWGAVIYAGMAVVWVLAHREKGVRDENS